MNWYTPANSKLKIINWWSGFHWTALYLCFTRRLPHPPITIQAESITDLAISNTLLSWLCWAP